MSETTFVIGSGDRALWMGLGPVRLAVLGCGVLSAVMAGYGGMPLPVAALPVLLAAGWSFSSVHGVPLHDLTSSGAAYASRVLAGKSRVRACLNATETRDESRAAVTPVRLPKVCGQLTLSGLDVAGVEVGVLCERGRHGWDALCLFDVVGDAGFSLLDPAEQTRRLASWGDVLTALAGEYADRCRLQWIETAAHDPLDVDDSDALAQQVQAASLCHRTLLAVRVATGQRDQQLAVRHAEPLQQMLAARLLAADLVAQPLDRAHIRHRFAEATTGKTTRPPVRSRYSPPALSEAWDHLRLDDTWHRGYLVVGWPRVPVGPTWLAPLLTEGPTVGRRSVAMHFVAVRADVAGRRARAARQSAVLDSDDRARLGFGIGARERRGEQEAVDAEEELAAGHTQHRVAGLVLVSAASPAQLAEAARQTVAAASAARLEVRPLHGRHADAWAAGLPLCRLGHRTPA